MSDLNPAGLEAAAKAIHGGNGCTCRAGASGDAETAVRAYLSVVADTPPENPYPDLGPRFKSHEQRIAWDEGFAAGRAAPCRGCQTCRNLGRMEGRAAAHPDPPMRTVHKCPSCDRYFDSPSVCSDGTHTVEQQERVPVVWPDQSAQHAVLLDEIRELHQENERLRAASPDERLRETNDLLDQIQMYEEKAERGWRDFGEMQDARIAADDRVAALDDLVQRAWSLIAGAMSGSPRMPTANSDWMDAAHAWEVDYCMGQGTETEALSSACKYTDSATVEEREYRRVLDLLDSAEANEAVVNALMDAVECGADLDSEARAAITALVTLVEADRPEGKLGAVSYRVRDRDSDYKAMCHEDREHAELLLQAWLADGRDAVIESRIVYDAGWRQDGER